MAKELISDQLWAAIESLLPPEPPKPKGGRPRIADRKCLTGVLFVLKTGIGWEDLPQEMGCGSGITCWRRLQAWHATGVWQQLQAVLLDRLGHADKIDWSRASVNSIAVPSSGRADPPARIRRIAAKQAHSASLWSPVRDSG